MKKTRLLFRIFFLLFILASTANTGFSQTKKVLFQGFWWDYENNNYPNGWANYLTELAPRLRGMGIDAVWIPPTPKNEGGANGVGYAPFDHYDLGDKFQKGTVTTRIGTKDELLRMVAVLHANGLEVIQDIVPNHVIGAGSDNGSGGTDPSASGDQFKNFRYVCYETPATDQSETDYFNRKGRFFKNKQNFHPNFGHDNNTCNSGNICGQLFGPDVCYQNGAFGQSSNATYNPSQNANYMTTEMRNWLIWSKKQIGFDGVRVDAVKHFPEGSSQDFIANLQNNSGFASGGDAMFAVGEYVGSKGEIDGWTSGVQNRAGTFDFSLRGALYGMVTGNGFYNMAQIKDAQQNIRFIDYGIGRVHRTVPFVNNHDTFRPAPDANGNYNTWNTGQELAPHIEPNNDRMPLAYAISVAVDGNPQIFFEDLFDIGYNSNRYTHIPSSSASLPERAWMTNLIWCHQVLGFKDGDYKVRTATPDGTEFYIAGSNDDMMVVERSNKALIALNDNGDVANGEQDVFVDTDFAQGTVLKDYSGVYSSTTTVVGPDPSGSGANRVRIKAPPIDVANNRYGYAIWAPTGFDGATIPVTAIPTTQEWEMSDDLGDSHCNSLMQGGSLPANSTNQRIAGRIFTEIGQNIAYELFPESGDVTVSFHNVAGDELHTHTGGSGMNGTFSTAFTGWVTIKVRNATTANVKQKCFVKVTYTAPQVVNTSGFSIGLSRAIWTGNGGDSDVGNCQNWEEGKFPNSNTNVVIPGYSSPAPNFTGTVQVKDILIETGANLQVDGTLEIFGNLTNNGSMTACGTVAFKGNTTQTVTGNNQFCVLETSNANSVDLTGENIVTQELRFINGKFLLNSGDLILQSGATITGNSATKYVQTQNSPTTDGFLVQEVGSANGSVLFPIGNDNYNPVTLTNTGTTRNFSARVFDGVLANGTSGANIENGEEVNKSWEITPDGTGVDANVTVQWNASEQGGGFTASEAALSKNDGADWETLASSAVGGTNPYTISAGNVTTFSTFAVGSAGSNFTVLPVELLTFEVEKDGVNALLNWTTVTEINNEGFAIEKSLDGQVFTKIGFVKGAGNTAETRKYRFVDKQFSKNSYYRLRQLDFDGGMALSQVVFLKKDKKGQPFSVAPNPFSERITLRADADFDENKVVKYRLFSIDGKVLLDGAANLKTAENSLNQLLENAEKGVYLLSLNDGEVLKLIKE